MSIHTADHRERYLEWEEKRDEKWNWKKINKLTTANKTNEWEK